MSWMSCLWNPLSTRHAVTTGKKCSVALKFHHHTACSLVVMLELCISPLRFWVYVNSHFNVIVQNCSHQSVHIASFFTILKYLFWLKFQIACSLLS
jgi:hypothetical protein